MTQTNDFGGSRRPTLMNRGAQNVLVGAGITVLALLAAMAMIKFHQDAAESHADNALWTVSGPPCPSISAAWYQTLAIAHPTPFAFEGLQGEMAHGDVSCSELDAKAGETPTPVCQFRAPFAVRVTTPGGAAYFETIPGRPMTVSLPAGGPARCVLGANLTSW